MFLRNYQTARLTASLKFIKMTYEELIYIQRTAKRCEKWWCWRKVAKIIYVMGALRKLCAKHAKKLGF